MIARAPSQSPMVAWPATPKFCTTPITFLSSALPLSSTLRPWPSSVPVTSSIYRPEERLMFAASFTVAPASMVVGNSSAEATVTASLSLATRASPDCWHSAPFSAFYASAASHSFCRSAAASAPSSGEGSSTCGSSAEMPKVPSAGPADRSLSVGRAFSAGCALEAATASFVLSISLGFLLRLRLGFCGNYRIKDRLMRWKTTSQLITHVCPNK